MADREDASFGRRLSEMLERSRGTKSPAGAPSPATGATNGGDENLFELRLNRELARSRGEAAPIDGTSRIQPLPGYQPRAAAPENASTPDLAEVIEAWPRMAPAIKASILSLVRASVGR